MSILKTDFNNPYKRLYYLLILITLLSGCMTVNNAFINSIVFIFWEYIFIIISFFCLRRNGYEIFIKPFKIDQLTSILLFLWMSSTTISFFCSPYDLYLLKPAILRYVEVPMHVLFCFFCFLIFSELKENKYYFFTAIPLTVLLVIAAFFFSWFFSPKYLSHPPSIWFESPPMNGHIRHTGYHITAGLAVLLPMVTFFHPDRTKLSTLLILIISLTSHWAFLFWTGGRGAIISVFAASLFVAAIAYRDNTNFRFYILIALSTAIVGFVIAELYSVFFWNGVLSSLDRMNISSGINKLSTGRMEFWKTSLHSLKQSPFFGLGPQGYYYMPNRVFGLHPHNFIIQFLVEWGLIGTLLILAVLFRVLKKGFKNLILGSKSKNNQTRLIGASIVVALTIHALTDGTYYHGQPSFYLAIGYASMLIPFYHQKDMK